MAYSEVAKASSEVAKASTIKASISSRIEELDPVIERAANYVGLLQNILSRIRGSQPAEVGREANPTSPHCILDAFNRRCERLVDIMNDMERLVREFDDVI